MQTDMLFALCSCASHWARGGRGVLGLAAFCAALSGCAATTVERGAEFYDERRYIDAAQVFEHNEQQLEEYEAKERAEYAVYRGATLLALGDRNGARQWLAYGARVGGRLLSPRDRALLDQSLKAVEVTATSGSSVGLQTASGLAAAPTLLSR